MKVYAIRNADLGVLMSGKSRRPVYTRKMDAVKAARDGYVDHNRHVQIVEYTLGQAAGRVVHEFNGFEGKRVACLLEVL